MKYFDEELKRHAVKVRLKAAERRELRERILSYMEYHPLPKSLEAKVSVKDTIESQHFITIPFNTIYTKLTGVAFVLLIIVLPFAAERAVPGDVLYPIKTQFNEGVRAQFVNSPYEQVAFETKMLERRIAEARLLADKGKLTEEIEAAIAENVKEHAGAIQEGIVAMKTDDTDEGVIAEIAFASALDIQTAVLATDATADESATGTDMIALAVKEAQATNNAQAVLSEASFEGLMARIETETTRAVELFESINGAATEEERAQIERRLEDIRRAVTGARGMHASGADGAVTALRGALSMTQKLIVFMTDIDVRETVELDTIVPVVPTTEESLFVAEERYEQVLLAWEALTDAIDAIEDPALAEKVAVAVTDVENAIGTATSSLTINQFDVVHAALNEIEAYIADLETLLAPVEVPEPFEVDETDTDTTDDEDGEAGDVEGDSEQEQIDEPEDEPASDSEEGASTADSETSEPLEETDEEEVVE